MSERPWYRLHWVTWGVLIVVGGALVRAQCVDKGSTGRGGVHHFSYVTPYGFPFPAVLHTETHKSNGAGGWITIHTDFPIDYFGLLADALLFAVVIASSVFVLQAWCRSRQVTLGTLLAVPPIAGLLLAGRSIEPSGEGYPLWSHIEWYVAVPLVFGLGCTIYTAGWLTIRLVRRVYRHFIPATSAR